MLDDYKLTQVNFYNYVVRSIDKNHISHAYIIEANGVNDVYSIAISFAKFLLCENNYTEASKCGACNICYNINNDNYPDIKVIEPEGKVIKKEQILELQKDFSLKPLYGKYVIYIIKDANALNLSSSNTLLKFLEEPNENIIAILITDNIYNLIETIVSRCQILSLKKNNKELNIDIFKKYYIEDNDSFESFVNVEIEKYIKIYYDIENNKEKIFVNEKYYLLKDRIECYLYIGLYLYMGMLKGELVEDDEIFKKHLCLIKEIKEKNKIDDIIRKIEIINEFIEKNNFNVNKELFLDNFAISMIGVDKND